MSKPQEAALATQQPSALEGYAITSPAGKRKLEIVAENVGGALTARDLVRVKVPAGGMTQWAIPTASGDEYTAEIEGVIVLQQPVVRSYWKVGMDEGGGGTPPDCFSLDGRTGVGDPGGPCHTCGHSQWGTGKQGRGQACQARRILYILRQGSLFPLMLSVPPGSADSVREYVVGVGQEGDGTYLHEVVTKFTLVKVKGNGTPDYAQIKCQKVGTLNPEDRKIIEEYRANFGAVLASAAAPQPLISAEDMAYQDAQANLA
jgi:hypothetical protein